MPTGFFEIAFVWEVHMRVFLCVYMSAPGYVLKIIYVK